MDNPSAIYHQLIKELQEQLATFTKKQNLLGWMRLILIVVTAIVAYQLFYAAGSYGWLAIIVGLTAFIVLVTIDTNNNHKIFNAKKLLHINKEELSVLSYHFQERFDGSEYVPDVHAYAGDLDVFGKFSLFQYVNRCFTQQGRNLLAKNFLSPITVAEINERHTAIKELAKEYIWRQQLQAYAMQTPVTVATEKRIESWLQQQEEPFQQPVWKIILPLYALITTSTAIAALLGYMHPSIFALFFIVYFTVSSALSKKPTQAYIKLNGVTAEVSIIQQLVQWIENKNFSTPLLVQLQQKIKTENETAGSQIKNLKNILNRFDLRLNVFVFIFLNSFFLWDVWQMRALNGWKRKNKTSITNWFSTIAEFEVLNSLSALHFNKPQWCFPKFNNNYFFFKADELGHPLISDHQRVDNDFYLSGTGKISLITGSNMAGKSTFLRSLGANTILAQLGAPVCAKDLELSPVNVMSSMRISDNLAENTSTFYAELKKLQSIIEAVNQHLPVFILLDEILRGTNSLDRHIGSKALIRQLIKEKSIAVIATHDVELSKLVEDYEQEIENYHFDVQVAKDDELFFDYKLKEGVCQSLNASILMRKIGIELE